MLEDVVANRRQGRSVVLHPRRPKKEKTPLEDDQLQLEWNQIKPIVRVLLNQDVVIVACSGDDARALPASQKNLIGNYPAVSSSKQFPIIAAGSVRGAQYAHEKLSPIGTFSKFSGGAYVMEDVI